MTQPSVSPAASGASAVPRYPVLDELRGTCVIVLVIYHSLLSTPFESGRTVDHVLQAFVPFMTVALDMFFVISGFLITLILDNTRDADQPIKTFYIRRVLRIVPLYYGFLLFAALFLQYLGPVATGKQGSTIWEWTFLTNWKMGLDGPKSVGSLYPHFWSLGVEEHFYLIWPWVVMLLPPKRLMKACAVVALMCLAGRIIMATQGYAYASWLLTPTRLDGLALGGLAALLHKYHPDIVDRWGRLFIKLTLFVLAPALFGLWTIFFSTNQQAFLNGGAVIGPFVFSLLFSSVVGLVANRNNMRPRTSEMSVLLKSTARYSYGMYAFHVPIIVILFHTRLIPQSFPIHAYGFPYRMIFSATILGLSYVAGFLSWEFFESVILRRAPRYSYSRRDVVATPLIIGTQPMPVP